MQGALPLYASVLLFWKVSGSTTAAAWRSRRREFARRSVLALPRWIANAMESTKSFLDRSKFRVDPQTGSRHPACRDGGLGPCSRNERVAPARPTLHRCHPCPRRPAEGR